MIVSTISPTVRPAEQTARPSKIRIHASNPEPRVNVAALLRRALICNELLLTVAAAPRPLASGGR